jgi:hypothetical protein
MKYMYVKTSSLQEESAPDQQLIKSMARQKSLKILSSEDPEPIPRQNEKASRF